MMKPVFVILLITIVAVIFAQSSVASSMSTLGFQPAEITALVTPLASASQTVTYIAGSFSCYSGCTNGDTLSFTFNSTAAKISSIDIVLYDIKNNQPMITLPKGKKMINIQVKNNRLADYQIPWITDLSPSLGQNVMFNGIIRYEQLPSLPILDQIEFKYTPPTLASSIAYCPHRFAQNPTKLGGVATSIFVDNKNPNDFGQLILDAKDLTANTVGIVLRMIGGHQQFISQSKDILTNPNDSSQIAFLTTQGSLQGGAYHAGELLIERPYVQITNAFPLLWHPSASTTYIEMSFVTEEEKQYLR
eukprot:UN02504